MLRKSLQFPSVFYIKRREGLSLAGNAFRGRIFLKQRSFFDGEAFVWQEILFYDWKDFP